MYFVLIEKVRLFCDVRMREKEVNEDSGTRSQHIPLYSYDMKFLEQITHISSVWGDLEVQCRNASEYMSFEHLTIRTSCPQAVPSSI
jgi:hypothetical protein